MAARKNPAENGRLGKGAKHGENLVQRTRAAILNALDVVDSRGKKISELLADEFEKNPLKFMELAAKAMPKEVKGNVSHDHQHQHTHETVSETVEWIEGMLGIDQTDKAKKPRPN